MNTSRFVSLKGTANPAEPNFNAIGSKVKAYAQEHSVPHKVSSATPARTEPPPRAALTPLPVAKKLTHRLTVDIPSYLYDDIKDRAKRTTVRFVVLSAFAEAGHHVAPEDLIEDGRREPSAA